ncbi:MAG: TIGR04282 family arsenosugar biosynthesis glycosyltransferase [Polaribacter sp.]|nr:TIGR04282 family arsenosugar biosynthesis glycosyltransferase [Polaribacter sp.]MDG1811694.1 TIGR04282 family arsenosugar biosynthesis glycosyltransferase [Polaribacter sp.]MDG1993374.1 TIGR04282 family arsenosugar biosynthesis glycosyltransferase [Polaribacter sp.]
MSKNLVIIFVKNIILGQVKTRLAKTIGDIDAYNIYSNLVTTTEKATLKLAIERHIYFSNEIMPSFWKHDKKFVQKGADLGSRMQQAFQNGFDEGYENIVLIGSDLPTISKEIVESGISKLKNNDIVFGPAEDGGYYLVGMSKMHPSIFKDKPWSTSNLLTLTLQELKAKNHSVTLIETLNDIDTFEDLIASDFYKNNSRIQEIVKQNKAIK